MVVLKHRIKEKRFYGSISLRDGLEAQELEFNYPLEMVTYYVTYWICPFKKRFSIHINERRTGVLITGARYNPKM